MQRIRLLIMLLAMLVGTVSCDTSRQDPKWKRIWEHADEYQKEEKADKDTSGEEENPVLPLDSASKPCVTSDLDKPGC